MYKVLIAASSLALMATFGQAQTTPEKSAEVETRDALGNTLPTEKVEALKRRGNVKSGRELFKAHCEACHLPSGAGQRDGSIPQLAGQHGTVLIKQLTDIRSGQRYNPTMYPFARKLADPQAIADVAAYVVTLCISNDSGKYQGADAVAQITEGKLLYERECAQCHQPNGEGLKEMFYPVLAGQHFQYLLRQMTDIHDAKRLNVPAEMFAVISKYNKAQLLAISAYQASLKTPYSMLTSTNAMCKANPAKLAKGA